MATAETHKNAAATAYEDAVGAREAAIAVRDGDLSRQIIQVNEKLSAVAQVKAACEGLLQTANSHTANADQIAYQDRTQAACRAIDDAFESATLAKTDCLGLA